MDVEKRDGEIVLEERPDEEDVMERKDLDEEEHPEEEDVMEKKDLDEEEHPEEEDVMERKDPQEEEHPEEEDVIEAIDVEESKLDMVPSYMEDPSDIGEKLGKKLKKKRSRKKRSKRRKNKIHGASKPTDRFRLIVEKTKNLLDGQEINMDSVILLVTDIMAVVEEYMSKDPGTAKKQMALQVFRKMIEEVPDQYRNALTSFSNLVPLILDSMADVSKGKFSVQTRKPQEEMQVVEFFDQKESQEKIQENGLSPRKNRCCILF